MSREVDVLRQGILPQKRHRVFVESQTLFETDQKQASAGGDQSSSSHVTMALPALSWSALHFCKLSADVT